MLIKCCAKEYCIRLGQCVEFKPNGDPRHRCMHCRQGMCGGTCGIQFCDVEARAKEGYVFDIKMIHPLGREEVKGFNNDNVMLCHKCGKELKEKAEQGNNFDLLRYVFLLCFRDYCQPL